MLTQTVAVKFREKSEADKCYEEMISLGFKNVKRFWMQGKETVVEYEEQSA